MSQERQPLIRSFRARGLQEAIVDFAKIDGVDQQPEIATSGSS